MKISELKVPSIRRSYSTKPQDAPPEDVCSIVPTTRRLTAGEIQEMIKEAEQAEEFEEPADVDLDLFTDATDLMETTLKLLEKVLDDDNTYMEHMVRQRLLNHRLDLYHFLREHTDLEEREQNARKMQLRREIAELMSGNIERIDTNRHGLTEAEAAQVFIDKTVLP